MGGRTIGAACVLAAALLMTGCAGGGATPTDSPAPTTASPTPTATPTPTPSGSVDPNAPAGQCADSALRVTIEDLGGAAGSIGYDLVFENTGSESCELRGAPGVSVVNDAGVQLGEAAERQGDENPPTLTLEPGGSVVAQLVAVNIGTDGGPLADSCPVVEGTAYLVYPPHSFTAVEVTTGAPVPACESSTPFLTVGPVQARN
jgi:hypothetical protein